ncbi:MAG: GTPase HflX [Bavariicoccus seileri]|uniref:GTPase HflX n=1 Tax=Bavariicoccus seileri TaxID=549685 RepID=UPI003F9880B3
MEKVILIAVNHDMPVEAFEANVAEMTELVKTAGGEVQTILTQNLSHQKFKTFIGTGKIEEAKRAVEQYDCDLAITNQDLSPSQLFELQKEIDLPVIDRSQLILDIFAGRANSKAGKIQVALAQMEYLLPRLSGQGVSLSRQAGGIGSKGPGETKLETDRRVIRRKITQLKKEITELDLHRERSRDKRKNSLTIDLGLIGYTNAGKSTLMNQLTDAKTYEKDELFATLDPLTRKCHLPNGLVVTLTDTVGFLHDLPHNLIAAFQSTLKESSDVDLLLHVVDASSPFQQLQEDTVINLIKELDMDRIERLTIYNKKDLISTTFMPSLYPNIVISAKSDEDIRALKKVISDKVKGLLTPFSLHLDPEEYAKLRGYDSVFIQQSLEFDEDTETYILTGFAPARFIEQFGLGRKK